MGETASKALVYLTQNKFRGFAPKPEKLDKSGIIYHQPDGVILLEIDA